MGWSYSGDGTVLLSVPQEHILVAEGAGLGVWTFSVSIVSFLSPSFWETADIDRNTIKTTNLPNVVY